MSENSTFSRNHESQTPLAIEGTFISDNINEECKDRNMSINYLGTDSSQYSSTGFKDQLNSYRSLSSLSCKSKNLNNTIAYQNSNLCSSRSLSNKLPLNTVHKMTLGKHRHPLSTNSTPGFPTKMPEIKKKSSSAPPEEVKSLELKIQLVKKRLRSTSFNEPEEEFKELESDILKDVNEVTKSINKVLEYRKEIQNEHRKWLEDRKRKILETKKETKIIKDSNAIQFSLS